MSTLSTLSIQASTNAPRRNVPIKEALAWRADFYYDRREARRAIFFFENELRHMEGEFEGRTFSLEYWQRRMLRRIFGWKRRTDNTRKFRKVFLFVPTGNGKSFIVAGIGNYLFVADREPGAQVVAAAADTEQAGIIFNYAKFNAVRNPKLRKLIGKTFHRSMAVRSTGSSFRVLSSAANTKHGFNLHGCLIDEVHAHKKRELIDVLITRTRTRRQPLTVYATTAGFDKETICGELYDYAKKVRDGLIVDQEFYPVIFEADADDDWRKRETWVKANPNFGVTVKESFLEAECKMAQELPRNESRFKRMHLNMWTESEMPWLPMEKWRACGAKFQTLKPGKPAGTHFTEAELEGMPCYGGLDLASRLDVAALALAFDLTPELSYFIVRFWVPMETALDRQRKGQAPYHDWIREGHMIGTPGNDIDYAFLREDIKQLAARYKVREIGFDPWNANQLTHQLNDQDGITMIPMRQGWGTMSAPSKELEARLVSEKIRHGNQPVMTWMASNVCVATDPAGNIKPNKGKNRLLKIDGIVALVMALGRQMVDDKNRQSVYDTRGVITF